MIETARTWRLLKDLRAGSSRSPRALAEIQAALLRRALAHAYQQVPFYRRVWDDAGLYPGSVSGLEDIERVPIVNGSMVRNAFEREEMVARGVDAAQCHAFPTGGFSGEPLNVPRQALEERLWRAGSLRIWFEHGYRWRHATAHFDSRQRSSHPLQRLRISRTSWIPVRSTITEQLAGFEAARADVVVGTPTVLRRTCRAIEAAGASFHSPRIVFTKGELLDKGTRALIERVLGVAPIELYGLTEVGFVGWQCEQRGDMHVSAETCVAEVRRGGRPARAGELGAVVVTDLRSRTMPLIRYDTGDLAVAAQASCPCGRPLPLIGSIEGRARCAVTLADDRVLTMRTIVDHLADTLAPDTYRLHQEAESLFRLQLDPGVSSAAADESVRSLSELLSGAKIQLAGDLPPAAKGTEKSHPVSSAIVPDLA